MSALLTEDPDAATAFYAQLFGWEAESFQAGEVTATIFRLPGFVGGEPEQPVARDVVATMIPHATGDLGPRWSVDFWVGDHDATIAAATAAGGAVVTPPFDLPGMRQAVLADPAGAQFSVTQLQLGGAG
jgi:uncharacterized protein